MTGSSRILIVDDEESLRQTLVSAFQEHGYDTLEADCGARALEIGNLEQLDLSVLDINMPDMTGVDVLRQWLQAGLCFPVIFMTAEANQNLTVEATELGAAAVLRKPFGVKEIFGLVDDLLRA